MKEINDIDVFYKNIKVFCKNIHRYMAINIDKNTYVYTVGTIKSNIPAFNSYKGDVAIIAKNTEDFNKEFIKIIKYLVKNI